MPHLARVAPVRRTSRLALAGWLAVPALLAAQAPPGPAPAAARGAFGERFAATRRIVDSIRAATGVPGVAIVVTRGDSVLLATGVGVASIETGAPITPAQVTQVGSVTKPFTATLALLVAADGRLRLDAPIGAVVQGLRPAIGALTTAALLAGTAGLVDQPGGDGTHEEGALLAVARTRADSLVALPPGETFSYSNIGFALAGLAAQEAAHEPYADLLRRRILAPLGMATATMRPLEALTHPFVQGHVRDADGRLQVVRPVEENTAIGPAGYLHASALELSRFATALANDGRVEGRQRLPADVVRALRTPRIAIPSMPRALHYGLGLFVDDFMGGSAWHTGSTAGHSAIVRTVPAEGLAVVVLANLDNLRLDAIAEAALRDAHGPAPLATTRPAPRALRPATPAELRAAEGRYANRLLVDLRRDRDTLRLVGVGPARLVRPVGVAADGRLWLAVTNPAGTAYGDTVVVTPARAGRPAYANVFLWSLPRISAPAAAAP